MEQEAASAALDVLSEVQLDGILSAFNELPNWSYTRYDFTENRNAHQYESSTHLVRVDSSGSLTVIIGSDSMIATDLSDTVEAMMPDDTPYLTERFKDDFYYDMRGDTSYWSRPAHKITIRSRPGSDQDIFEASYILDASSNKLVHTSFHKYNRTILFEELSRYNLQLRPVGATWLPYRLNTHVTLKLPSGQQQIFVRNVIFYNYIARPGS